MADTPTTTAYQWMETENHQLQKLNDIVLQSVEEQKLITQRLCELEEDHPAFGSRMADRIALIGGSWKFIAFFSVCLIAWMLLNSIFLLKPFDPYPYIFLNLILSTVAALQAPIIMMSQNRKEEKDRQRSIHDYMVNLKAEIEVRNLHQKLDLLITEQMKTLFEVQKAQMCMMEDLKAMMQSKANGLIQE